MVTTYREHPAISQSQLKLLLGDPELFITVREPDLYFEEKEHFVIGNAVDCLLTTPEQFESDFHVSTLEQTPSDTIKSMIKWVFDKLEERPSSLREVIPTILIDACNVHEYYTNWTNDQTRINKVIECDYYWQELLVSHGKTILTVAQKTLIDSIVMSIRTNEVTSEYFQPKKNQEIQYQLALYFEYEGVECKALLDMVLFDHETKKILPIDFKTLGDSTINFLTSLKRRRYDIQAAFYTKALEICYPGYQVLSFEFIVESTTKPGNPLVFTCTEELLKIGQFGIKESYNITTTGTGSKNREVLGFHDLIELYKFYTEHGFEKHKTIVENNSKFTIGWNEII